MPEKKIEYFFRKSFHYLIAIHMFTSEVLNSFILVVSISELNIRLRFHGLKYISKEPGVFEYCATDKKRNSKKGPKLT